MALTDPIALALDSVAQAGSSITGNLRQNLGIQSAAPGEQEFGYALRNIAQGIDAVSPVTAVKKVATGETPLFTPTGNVQAVNGAPVPLGFNLLPDFVQQGILNAQKALQMPTLTFQPPTTPPASQQSTQAGTPFFQAPQLPTTGFFSLEPY